MIVELFMKIYNFVLGIFNVEYNLFNVTFTRTFFLRSTRVSNFFATALQQSTKEIGLGCMRLEK